ncbi:hypothetical protein [Ancylomarina longa]|nr:hypothetical protein [Ancylomarina longa]
MENQKFELELGNRLYEFFLDILVSQKKTSFPEHENTYASIWEFWEKEL